MRAATYEKFGPPSVLTLKELEKPLPGPQEILIRVKAVAVTAGEIKARSLVGVDGIFWLPARLIFGFSKPKSQILGSYFAGIVAEVGEQVSRFQPGQRVFGYRMLGANAEYMILKETAILSDLPESIEFIDAAAAGFGLSTAMKCLEKANLRGNSRILINGASGGVGLAAVQLAKQAGAEVTGTCSNTKIDLVKKAGADYVIDYRSQSLDSRKVDYDTILDTSGKLSFSHCVPLLKPQGTLHLIDFKGKDVFQAVWTGLFGKKKVICHVVEDKIETFERIKNMILKGQYRPIIDRTFPLEQLAEAHRHFESGHKKGDIVIAL